MLYPCQGSSDYLDTTCLNNIRPEQTGIVMQSALLAVCVSLTLTLHCGLQVTSSQVVEFNQLSSEEGYNVDISFMNAVSEENTIYRERFNRHRATNKNVARSRVYGSDDIVHTEQP
uniref:Uncharacterized protein n=1 Tax=Timema cristinae TaxID=61476 RepID=A0A7R9DA50_TIMCR|nr:unnamed protein product [Timema cristinae]